jgi:hypothetical protein
MVLQVACSHLTPDLTVCLPHAECLANLIHRYATQPPVTKSYFTLCICTALLLAVYPAAVPWMALYWDGVKQGQVSQQRHNHHQQGDVSLLHGEICPSARGVALILLTAAAAGSGGDYDTASCQPAFTDIMPTV